MAESGPVVGTLRVKIVPDAVGLQAKTAKEAEAAGEAAEAAAQAGAAKTRKKSRKANVAEATAQGAAEGKAHGTARQQASQAAQKGTNKPNVAAAAAKGAAEGKAEGAARQKALEKELQDFRVRSALLNSQSNARRLLAQQQVAAQAALNRKVSRERTQQLGNELRVQQQLDDARRGTLRLLDQQRYAARQHLMDEARAEDAARKVAARQRQQAANQRRMAREQASYNAFMFRRQQAQEAAQQAAVKRRRGLFSRSGGRAGFDTDGGLQRAAKSYAFIGGGPLRGIASTLGLIGGNAAVAGGAVAALGTGLVAVGAAAAGLTVGAVAFGAFSAAALKGAGALEQQKIAFTTLLKSGEKGTAFLDDVLEFAKATPFDALGVADGAKKLLAYGFAAEDVLPILTDLGDATSALGLGNDGLGRLILAFGQIRTAGKLTGMEARQLSEAGIPVWEILAEKVGATTGEIKKMTEEGAIPAELAIEALREGMQNTFGGSLKAQAESLLGTFEKIKESATLGLYQALLPSLPKIASQMREFAPALEGLSVALGRGLGTSLTDFLDGIEPAVSRVTTSLTTLLPAIMRDWTPAYTDLTNGLLNAFQAAVPGIKIWSSAFASAVSTVSGIFEPLATKFSEMSVDARNLAAALAPVGDILGKIPWEAMLGDVTNILPPETRMFVDLLAAVPAQILVIRAAWSEFLVWVANSTASMLEKLPFGEKLAAGLRVEAGRLQGEAEELFGQAARVSLPVEVQMELDDTEATLAGIADKVGDLPISLRGKIDVEGIRTGSIDALRELSNLPAVELKNIGIDKATLQAQVTSLESLFSGLSPEILATINADPAEAEQKVAELRAETEKEWRVAVNMGSVNTLIEAAAAANTAIDKTKTSLLLFDNTTGEAKLYANADPAEQELAFAEGRIATYDGLTGSAKLLAQDEASAAIFALTGKLATFDASSASAVAGLDDQATSALDDVFRALMAYGGSVAIGTAGVNDQASPQIADLRAALAAWDASGGSATVDADSPAGQVIAQAQAALAEWDAAVGSGDVNAIDNASAKISNVIGLLDSIPRYVPVKVEVQTQYSAPIGPGLDGGQSILPRSGGSVPIDGGGGEARSEGGDGMIVGGRAASARPTTAGGYYAGLLNLIVTQAQRLANAGAAAVSKALREIYDSEIATQRRIDDEREAYYRQLDFGVARYRQQLEAAYNVNNLEGAAQEQARFLVEWRVALREQEVADIKKANDRALEDQQRFYQRQQQLADEMAARMEQIQSRVRDTVDWGESTNPAALIRNLRKSADVFNEFARNLAALQARGLSTAAQEALEALDPAQAATITRRLLDNPDLINELNKAYGDLLTAGIAVSDRFVDPVKAAGSVIGGVSSGITTSGKQVPLGQQAAIVVNQTIQPSPGMNERQLANVVGKELMWRLD